MKPTTITQLAEKALDKGLTDDRHGPLVFSLKPEDDYLSEVLIKVSRNHLGMVTHFCITTRCSKPKVEPCEKFIYPHQFNEANDFVILVTYQCMHSRQQFKKQHKLNLALARQITFFGTNW